jgi:hypothetical protein
MVVLRCALTCLGAANLAEYLAGGAKSGLVDLVVTLDDVNDDAVLVDKLGDVLHTLIPSHDGALIIERLDKCHSGGGSHCKPFILGEFLTTLLVDRLFSRLDW